MEVSLVKVSASPPTVALLREPRSCVGLIKSPHSRLPLLHPCLRKSTQNLVGVEVGGGPHPHPPPHPSPPHPLCSCRQSEGQGELVGGGHLSGDGAAEVADAGHGGRNCTAVLLLPLRDPGDVEGRAAAQVLRAGRQQVSQNTPELLTKLHFLLVFLLFYQPVTLDLF